MMKVLLRGARIHQPMPERENFRSIARYIHAAKHSPGFTVSQILPNGKIYWPGENGGRELGEVLSAN